MEQENKIKRKKNTNLVDISKKYLVWFFSILFLELSFIVIMGTKIDFESIMNIILFDSISSSLLSIISNIFSEKANTVITSIILFVFGVLFSIQCVFYSIFKIYFSLTNLGLGDQVTSYLDKAFSAIIGNIISIIIFLLPYYQLNHPYLHV